MDDLLVVRLGVLIKRLGVCIGVPIYLGCILCVGTGYWSI